MELKPYQQQAINDLRTFLSVWSETPDPVKAFSAFWQNHARTPLNAFAVEKYTSNVEGVPHVCLKVPTAGGKTFMACNAIKPIFDHMPIGKPQVVVWLVPSTTILEQTIKNLSNPHHPYRQKIDTHFGSRVDVYTKEQVLMGANFSPTTVKEQLSIIVGSFSSFKKTNNKDARKVFQENSNLAEFPKDYSDQGKLVEDTDETALIQVINQMNPVIIVDESHNAESSLSVDMLQNLNPSFILDLTATPKDNSNIISYTDAWQLKKEHMVKLPVIVYNHHDAGDVITNSLHLRNQLEQKAIAEEKLTGCYIRPIILFQAQTKNEKDENTFLKVKNRLVRAGIPEEQIAIKTAEINEIKKWDLQSRDCPIRYIITINALKEGWDCPFAYILATLANRSSAVDVEQILGRILRQPYVKQHKEPMLNLSFVFTASAQFKDTLDNIVKGLNRSGFSKNDYRLMGTTEEEMERQEVSEQLGLIAENEPANEGDDMPDLDAFEIIADSSDKSVQTELSQIESKAMEESKRFEEEMTTNQASDVFPADLFSKIKSYPVKDEWKQDIDLLVLPQFFITKAGNLFDTTTEVLVEKTDLLEGFELKRQNTEVSFESVSSQMFEVDINKNSSAPEYRKVKETAKAYVLKYLEGASEERQLSMLVDLVFAETRKIDSIADSDMKTYIKHVIDGLNTDQITDLKQNPYNYAKKIRDQIIRLTDSYAETMFYSWLDSNKISIWPSYNLPKSIIPTDIQKGMMKSLYTEENAMNGFEWEVINSVANEANTLFWHKNIERTGFYINAGFMNHYPDFIIKTTKGTIVILETKGEHLGNEDSAKKIKLGNRWASMAGATFKYFMVFKDSPIMDAYSMDQFFNLYRDL
jgi:type III restriction enzyme